MKNTATSADKIAENTCSWRKKKAQILYKNVVPNIFGYQYPGWKEYVKNLRQIAAGTHDDFADPAMITVYTINDYFDPIILSYWDQSELSTENREWKITVADKDLAKSDKYINRKMIHIIQEPKWYQYTVTDAV